MAAEIHDSSQFPISICQSIPPAGWCVEMQRLLNQARSESVALSGMKFYHLTRQSILSVKII